RITSSGKSGVAKSISPIGRFNSASRTQPPTKRASPLSAASNARVAGRFIQLCGLMRIRSARRCAGIGLDMARDDVAVLDIGRYVSPFARAAEIGVGENERERCDGERR